MKNLLAIGICAAGLLGLGTQSAAAQDDRAGTQAMEELLVPVTPRSVALGSTLTGGLGDLSAVEAIQSNPAGLLNSAGTTAMFSRSQYVADIGVNFVGVSQAFGNNAVALTLTSWDYGDILRTTEDAPDPSANAPLTYSASTFALGATYGRQFTDRIGAGFTLKALGRTIDNVNSNGIAVDAGITYVVPDAGLRFGVSLQNLGTEMTFSGTGLQRDVPNPGPTGQQPVAGEIDDLAAQLPSALNFGASYTRRFEGDISMSAIAGFTAGSYDLDQYSAGLELGYADLVYARGGVRLTPEPDQDFWQGWNLGAGLNLDLSNTRLRVDYAFRPTNFFGNVNVFSVGLNL